MQLASRAAVRNSGHRRILGKGQIVGSKVSQILSATTTGGLESVKPRRHYESWPGDRPLSAKKSAMRKVRKRLEFDRREEQGCENLHVRAAGLCLTMFWGLGGV